MALRPEFKKTVFDNGLTLVSERHPEFMSLSVGVWIRAGTRHEMKREAGVSHFIEHMLFKGTRKRSALDISRQVERVGGDFNAFTTREYTCFHIFLLERDLSLGLDILEDVVLNSNFASDELERERKVILQEILMVEESPEEMAHDIFFELIYPGHSLGLPILGTTGSIRAMRRQDLLGFFQRHYRPEQIILSVSGDVAQSSVMRRMKSLRGLKWPGRSAGKVHHTPARLGEKPKFGGGKWWVPRETEQVHLVWGAEALPYASVDRFAMMVLNTHLGGGMSSLLFQEIREKYGLAYTVYSNVSPFQDTGVFSIYAATRVSQVPLCLRLIEECVEKMGKDRLTSTELKDAKDQLKGTLLLSSESVESRMSGIAKSELFLGQYVPVSEASRRIDAVTPEDVRRVARQVFGKEKSILALGPQPTRQALARSGFSLISR